ncbi:MAG: hypothetical protein R3325_02065 [Thermoanaerobaculia bacterium]|nr:hypothetical protein [Thermoanaerobaculia bacterium]
MRFRTLGAFLLALASVVAVAYLTQLNIGLLSARFQLTAERSWPLYLVLLTVFLLGFLPAGILLLTQTLKRDLDQRRGRRLSSEARSLDNAYRRAVDYQADGQSARAASDFRSYLAQRPESFGGLLRYGEELRRLGQSEEAVEVHRRASVLYPQSVSVLYELIEDYEAAGDGEVAVQLRDRILRDFPGMGKKIMARRRNAALAAGEWREASRWHEKLEALLAEGGETEGLEREQEVRKGLAYERGVELLRAERVGEARTIFEQILAEEPRFLPAVIMRGEATLLDEGPEAALAIWKAGFVDSGSPIFLQRIEDHFIEREEPMEAIETLHGLITAAENDLLPRFFLGRLYYRLEMHEEALRVLEELRERIHPSPTFHFLLARLHERRGEMGMAVQSLSACVAEAGITTQEYVCRACRTKYPDWVDRCDSCGSWNSVEMDFEEEKLELGVRPGPIWAIYGAAEAFEGNGGREDS